MVKMRRLPEDDYMHEPETASNFNESRYYNWFDHRRGHGRLGADGQPRQRGLRRDDGVPLPARRQRRRSCSSGRRSRRHDEHNAGGLRFEVLEAVRGAPHHLRRQGLPADAAHARWPSRREAFAQQPARAVHDRPAPEERRPGAGRRARVGGGRAEARPRSREDVRPRPHRAAHALDRHRHRRRPDLRHHRRPRPARPLVGPALLAEHLVVPLAHRQPRPRTSASR